ncbi:hypothetical protein DB41_GE00040 [Neochlamydia sp. TUME1]|uniref:hypothetical protein n=1 Tax=Neochlamydia sp. TUME1 TaxID=1478174 RepID=UPI00058295FD|nr:hypothetical protein [Neochlamydia sp. TUME1]KIC76421.1 hypothetical protein DB41_GE00040 [Neochlamydia sp. TUME1]
MCKLAAYIHQKMGGVQYICIKILYHQGDRYKFSGRRYIHAARRQPILPVI